MNRLDRTAAALTIAQKVDILMGVALLVVVACVALTALLTSLQTALLVWLALGALVGAAAFLLPVRTDGLAACPDPTASFAEATDRFARVAVPSPEPLNPLCHPQLLDHGRRTQSVVVLLHGISSCPQAFVDFAPMLHARGHTVLALRMPRNGYADRATDALKALTAEDLRRWGDQAVDIAAGLGEEVIVLGISAGGTVAGWIGQNRPEAARVLLVAPMFGLARLGAVINAAIMRITLILPNVSIWKDPILRARFEGLPHGYKRQSSRAAGEILRLAHAASLQARAGRAAARSAVLVTNANDRAVDNAVAGRFVARWERRGLPVTRYVFAREFGLGHEIIDPMEPGADPGLTYPVLLRLIEGSGQDQPPLGRAAAGKLSRIAAATSRTVTST